jgi:Golgi phosphoprotein 3 (GPP34)
VELSLSEQLLLLGYDDASGRPAIPAGHLDYGLSAARLLDLTYAGSLTLADGYLIPTGKGTDPVLARLGGLRHTAEWWVYHLASPDYRQGLLDRLVGAGMLERRDHKLFGVFPVHAYPEVDPAQERALAQHLQAVLLGAAPPDQRSVSLLALAHGCGLDKRLFPRLDAATVRSRMAELTKSEWCGAAVRKIITAMNAAVISAVSGVAVSSAASAVPAT